MVTLLPFTKASGLPMVRTIVLVPSTIVTVLFTASHVNVPPRASIMVSRGANIRLHLISGAASIWPGTALKPHPHPEAPRAAMILMFFEPTVKTMMIILKSGSSYTSAGTLFALATVGATATLMTSSTKSAARILLNFLIIPPSGPVSGTHVEQDHCVLTFPATISISKLPHYCKRVKPSLQKRATLGTIAVGIRTLFLKYPTIANVSSPPCKGLPQSIQL